MSVLFRTIRTALLTFCAAALCAAPVCAADVLRFGLLDDEAEMTYGPGMEQAQSRTVQYLKRKIRDLDIEVTSYTHRGLTEAIAQKKVDFFIASSGFFVEVQKQGIVDLATLISQDLINPNACVGGTMIVRANRTDLQTIADLRGKRMAAPSDDDFTGYLVPMNEIAAAGFDPKTFFDKQIFTSHNYSAVLEQLYNGKADVGFLGSCMFELIADEDPSFIAEFRTLNPQTHRDMRCAFSTRLYPGWTLGAAVETPPKWTRAVLTTLLSMNPSEAGGLSWTKATDYSLVHDAYRHMHAGPYAYLDQMTVRRFVDTYWPALAVTAALLLAWILHWLSVERLVRRRTAELSVALEKQQASEAHAREVTERFNTLNRMAVTSQLSSIFAHEMRQPLAAIKYISRALMTRLSKPDPDQAKIQEALTLLRAEVGRADAIVEKVRSYAKEGADRTQPVSLTSLAAQTADDLRQSRPELALDITLPATPVTVAGDALEIQLALLNLIKNAAEACPEEPVTVTLETGAADPASGMPSARLCVSNGGKALTDTDIERMMTPLASGKAGGLGLGLQIVRSVAEAHRGSFTLVPRTGGGLTALLTFPLLSESSDSGVSPQ